MWASSRSSSPTAWACSPGRATLWGAGYYRSTSTGWIAAGGAAWAYVIAGIVIAAQLGGNARAYIQVLGLAIAAFFAYREAS